MVSAQDIEDFYLNLGYHSDNLRKALLKDSAYQSLLERKKLALTAQNKISPVDKKKYVLAVDADFEILSKCKQLEKIKLAGTDKLLVNLVKSQLELEWRVSLIEILNKLLKKYKK